MFLIVRQSGEKILVLRMCHKTALPGLFVTFSPQNAFQSKNSREPLIKKEVSGSLWFLLPQTCGLTGHRNG